MFQDVRFGLRMLAKSPGFTAVAALSLALGIGANTAIFKLIDAVLLKMLPVKNAQELVLFQWWSKPNQLEALRFLSGNTWEEGGRDFGTSFSYPTFQQIRAQGTGEGRPLADVLAFSNIGNMNVVANGEAESLLLASMGGALGLVLAWWGSRMLVTLLSTPEQPIPLDLSPDLRILGFCAAACLMTGLMFGLAPALRTTRVDLTPSLKRAGGRAGLGKMLMVAQTALSLVLLFGAGLFVRTLVNLENLDAGFDKEKLLLFGVNASRVGFQGAALNDFYNRVQQRVAALPGVVSATASVHALLSGSRRNNGLWVPGYTPQPGQRMSVMVVPAGPEFFHTMKIPLLRGRDFSERDSGDAPKVAVVNEAFVKRYFADRDPMGQRIAWDRTKPEMEIVGIARDAKYFSLRGESPATVYHPYRQETNTGWMHYEVRTAGDPHALIPEVQRALGALDRNVPVFDMKTQTEQIDELLGQERLFAKLSGFFGLLALVLVCVGLYGVLSYAVARRTSELGLRMALGAQRSDIVGMVARETLLLVLGGLAVGIPASLAAARLASSVISDLLYGLKAGDIPSVAIAATALAVVAAVAGAVPARRASRVEPMIALRYE